MKKMPDSQRAEMLRAIEEAVMRRVPQTEGLLAPVAEMLRLQMEVGMHRLLTP